MIYKCANCGLAGCYPKDFTRLAEICPTKDEEVQGSLAEKYEEPENHMLAKNAALVEAEGYGQQTRILEIINFANKCGYKKLGLAFCLGLRYEAMQTAKILEAHGFEVLTVNCKNGGFYKAGVGIAKEQTVFNDAEEVMCNPIGQAEIFNKEKTDFNIILGLCVGHDSLFFKYSKAPVTVFAAKDRVTGHNPLAAIYLSKIYYKDKLFPKK